MKWFKKAAAQGNVVAQYSLGVMYVYGRGVRQNKPKAKELFGKACDGGDENGCHGYKILNDQGIQ